MSRKLLDIGDARSAYLVVRDAAKPVKENSRVERLFMSGWIALQYLHDSAVAAGYFAHIQDVSIHPTSLARSHYWLGRALALAPPPSTADAGVERPELVRALDILYALNERSLAVSFLAALGDELNDVGLLAALGDLAEQRQDARGMLHLGRAALARGLRLEYYAFPIVGVPRYLPIGPSIDTALLFAVIRQESRFNPADLSVAHAMGLMQVTPTAGRETCKRFGCKYDGRRLRQDLSYNLQVGAAELGGLLEEYGGNHILAFAAYNAGRGRVLEWIKTLGDPRDPKVDPVDWVERIPIMETRNYVQRVTENMQVYRARFGANAPLTNNARQ